MSGTAKVFELIIGGILIVYFLGATWSGISTQLSSVNTSAQGGSLIVLVPLILAVGVIYLMYKNFVKG